MSQLGLGERVTYWTEIPTAWQNFSSFCGISTSRQQTAQRLNESSAGAKRNSFHPASRAATRPYLLMAHNVIRGAAKFVVDIGVRSDMSRYAKPAKTIENGFISDIVLRASRNGARDEIAHHRRRLSSPVSESKAGRWRLARNLPVTMPVTRNCIIAAGTSDTPSSAATRFTIDVMCGATWPMTGWKPAFRQASTIVS
jgi:hypothetical protein